MDAKEQAAGERRVKDNLITPLERRGLVKPSTLTKPLYEVMKEELCQMLAYMSVQNLQALAEVVAANPGGKGRDRFPIANTILGWARQIQSPPCDGSPLQRAVFAGPLGQVALDELWAPELLQFLRKERKWPNQWLVSQIKQRADDAMRRLWDIEMRLGRGDNLTDEDAKWRQHRQNAIQHCREIRDVAQREAAA